MRATGSERPKKWEASATASSASSEEISLLLAIERRVLWLATSLMHHANRVRTNVSGVKVGGHQASSASMASILTALWFAYLEAEDRASERNGSRGVNRRRHRA